MTLTYPKELFIPLFLHKRLLQLLVQPFQAPVQAGAEPQNRRWRKEARRRVLQQPRTNNSLHPRALGRYILFRSSPGLSPSLAEAAGSRVNSLTTEPSTGTRGRAARRGKTVPSQRESRS